MQGVPVIHVSLELQWTKAAEWSCSFTFNGKKREFVRPEMADAVMAATEFLERHAPIGLMRISPKLH